jgi:hypothetical protein
VVALADFVQVTITSSFNPTGALQQSHRPLATGGAITQDFQIS